MTNGASANGRSSRAEVYLMAFKSLSKVEREAVLDRLLEDPDLLDEVIDIALIRATEGEPSIPLDEYLTESRRRRNVG